MLCRSDVEAIDKAIAEAKADPRPSLIVCRTIIGYGLPTRQNTAKAHGEPPGLEELNAAKRNMDWPEEPDFYIPESVKEFYEKIGREGTSRNREWEKLAAQYSSRFPLEWNELNGRMGGVLPEAWTDKLPVFAAEEKGMATRAASGQVINAISDTFPQLVGGSADLTPSNNTWIKESSAYQSDNPGGRYLHFGVREHGMGSIVNGIAYHGGFIPYGATFLVFTDYMRGAIRISALSHLQTIWVMTHDSIGLGEDGPTHQPVEHLAALRAIPNLVVIRPADANETSIAWRVAIERKEGPTLIALTRQAVPTLDRQRFSPAEGLLKGAYVLADLGEGEPEIILMASGSEVSLVVAAAERLAAEGRCVRVVSFPSWELFKAADPAYQSSVLPERVKLRLVVEMGIGMGWERYTGDQGDILSIEKFGASAPYKTLMQEYGFTVDNVLAKAKRLLEKKR